MEPLRALVLNFNAPELNALAQHLALQEALTCHIRPYVNKGRWWERTLARTPALGRVYLSTFGRRRLESELLAARTLEAGVLADIAAAALSRIPLGSASWRKTAGMQLGESIRQSVSRAGVGHLSEANCVVAYQGFGLRAFRAAGRLGRPLRVLNYPIAHHREHQRMCREEAELVPSFAPTWGGFESWPRGYEAELDEEIATADLILTGSRYARGTFLGVGVPAERVVAISYGVDLELFRPAAERPRDGRFRVIYAGQLTQRKGLSYLLSAWRTFKRPDTELALVGSLMSDFAPFEPYRDCFEYVPHLTRPALAERYRQSDVFVFPTLLEGMGLVVLEAMACGLPAIVTARGPDDLVRDGVDGFVVPVRDPDAITACLERLYRDPELRLYMSRNAAARAREFGWDRYASAATEALTSRLRTHMTPQREPASEGRPSQPVLATRDSR